MVFYLKVKEVQTLLNNVNKTRDMLILRLMYLAPRVSDILGKPNGERGIRVENINWEENTIYLTVKGGKNITVFIDPSTLSLLRMYCQQKGIQTGKVFNITRQRIHQVIKGIAKKTGLKDLISAHKLRHSFAIHALDGMHLFIPNKLNIRQVQLQMGHSSLETTAQYLQYTTEDRREAFRF